MQFPEIDINKLVHIGSYEVFQNYHHWFYYDGYNLIIERRCSYGVESYKFQLRTYNKENLYENIIVDTLKFDLEEYDFSLRNYLERYKNKNIKILKFIDSIKSILCTNASDVSSLTNKFHYQYLKTLRVEKIKKIVNSL